MKLIIVCGQGSIGKSTFSEKLLQVLPSFNLISADTLTYAPINSLEGIIECGYVDEVEKSIRQQDTLCEFSNDQIVRTWIYDKIKDIASQVDIRIIQLRPRVEQLIEWDEKRKNRCLTDEEKNLIKKIYYHYAFATPNEYKQYNFKSVKSITIDNSKEIDFSNFISKLF